MTPGLPFKVVHVSPTYFAPESCLGGAERFVDELARAMAREVSVKLVTFGPSAQRTMPVPKYERVVLKSWTRNRITPFSPWLADELRGADVIHCHQYFTLPTFLAAWFGKVQGSRVFVTDLGGGAWTPGYQIDISRWIEAHLPISNYAARELPGANKRASAIFGGVDLGKFSMRPSLEHDGSVVFLGRILPHKGIHDFVEAVDPTQPLRIIGPVSDPSYLEHLRTLAEGKLVSFLHDLDDAGVVRQLQAAMTLVHPTPVDDRGDAGANELFGLALIEGMSCGCPPIASRAASLPEIVVDGTAGFLVPPNSPPAIRDRIRVLRTDHHAWELHSRASRRRAESFSWSSVVRRCLDAYGRVAA